MIAPEILTGGIVAVGAFLAGQWLPHPGRRKVKAPKPVQPICGCTHHHSFHDPKTGECHGTFRRRLYGSSGADLGLRDNPCTCRQYTGPQPLPEVYAPEITS